VLIEGCRVQSAHDDNGNGKRNGPLKTLVKDATSPDGSPTGIVRLRPATSMELVPHIDLGIQADYGCPSSPPRIDYYEAYAELLVKYHELEQDHNEQIGMYGDLKLENTNLKEEIELIRSLKSYKNAFDILNEKYYQDKARWKVWMERHRKKEAERADRKLKTEAEGQNVIMTPGPTSSPRPPTLSSDSSPVKPDKFPVEPVRKGGLFSNLQPPRKVNFQSGPNNMPEPDRKAQNEDAIHSDASSASIPETQEQDQPQLPQPIQKPAGNPNRNTDPDHPTSDFTSSDTGDEDKITPSAKVSTVGQQMYTPTALKTPVSIDMEGASWAKPVVIKSEPQSSQNDPGYHLFDLESLDLDDVGHPAPQEQTTPKKRQKLDNIEQASPEREGGNGQRLRNETGDDNENDITLPHKIRPNMIAEADTVYPPPPRPGVHEPVATPVRKTPGTTSPSVRLGRISTSSSAFRTHLKATKRAPRSHRGALVHVLDDGTVGTRRVGPSRDSLDIRAAGRLDDIFTSTPKAASLVALSKEAVNTRSAPQNKRPGFGPGGGDKDMFTTPTNASLKKRDAVTEPLPSKHGRKQPSTTTADFAINPAMNDGIDYAYHEVVRNRDARKCLPGCTRICCKEIGKFVEAAGMPLVTKAGPRWRKNSSLEQSADIDEGGKREFLDLYGRHREAFPRRNTPLGFWDSDMPDTQALKKRNEEAAKLDRERVEQRDREAMKGAKGRFVRKL